MKKSDKKAAMRFKMNVSRRPILIGLTITFLFFLAFFGTGTFLWYTQFIQELPSIVYDNSEPVPLIDLATFPIGVDPESRTITENPRLEQYIDSYLAIETDASARHLTRAKRFLTQIALSPLIQQLASPSARTLVIFSGERKEEVAQNFANILRWDTDKQSQFLDLAAGSTPTIEEGVFFPGKYVVERTATPQVVADKVRSEFSTHVITRYTREVSNLVPLRDALTIASLLEREAFDFTDMRIISGIIWNRLFVDMPLQLDASLQYVKGSQSDMPWWPRVRPADKFIDSPYNTYKNTGLPPGPIANPSVEAIVAALNPKQTDCFYYFHDQNGVFYCNETYEGHVNELKRIYGRGR